MASRILLLVVGVFLLCDASKIPSENETAISADPFPTSSDETGDKLPSDIKFDIAKLVKELLDKLRRILQKLLDYAERQFSKALEKGEGVIKKIEEETKLRIEVHEVKCWTKELAKVTKALLQIPKEVSKQIAQTLLDIGAIFVDIVSIASGTIEKAEAIGKQMTIEATRCITSSE
nr:unnamed protein product [Callosobruchus analis]